MSAIGTKRTSLVALHMSAFGVERTLPFALHMSAFDPKRTCPLPSAAGSGGYDGGKYEKQRQPGEHDNLLNAAGIEFA